MLPSYEEIIQINPWIARPKEEYEKLLNTLTEKGFVWDDKRKFFYNEKIGMHIRTQGLDLFDPERLERAYQTWSNPYTGKGYRTGYKSLVFLLLFIADLFLGWIFIPIKIWLMTLFVLLFIFILFRRISKKFYKLAGKTKKDF